MGLTSCQPLVRVEDVAVLEGPLQDPVHLQYSPRDAVQSHACSTVTCMQYSTHGAVQSIPCRAFTIIKGKTIVFGALRSRCTSRTMACDIGQTATGLAHTDTVGSAHTPAHPTSDHCIHMAAVQAVQAVHPRGSSTSSTPTMGSGEKTVGSVSSTRQYEGERPSERVIGAAGGSPRDAAARAAASSSRFRTAITSCMCQTKQTSTAAPLRISAKHQGVTRTFSLSAQQCRKAQHSIGLHMLRGRSPKPQQLRCIEFALLGHQVTTDWQPYNASCAQM